MIADRRAQVVFYMRKDREAVCSLRRLSERPNAGTATLALDALLRAHPSASGHPVCAAEAHRHPRAGVLNWYFPDDTYDPELLPGLNVLTVPNGDPDVIARVLASDPRIVYAEVPPVRDVCVAAEKAMNDPWFSNQWAVKKCGFPAAWKQLEDSDDPAPVAIIDTGYTSVHPDLPNPVVYETFEWPRKDVHGHGTCIAGILCAKRDNGYGLAGAAHCDPWVYKVLNNSFSWENYFRALKLTAISTASVLNISMGDAGANNTEKLLINACVAKGICVIAPIGNSTQDKGPIFPALYEDVIAVGSTDKNDDRASFSINDSKVEIAAPGVDLITTSSRGTGYAFVEGTSFSTAYISAACILIRRKHPTYSVSQVRSKLETLVATGTNAAGLGAGRLDLSKL